MSEPIVVQLVPFADLNAVTVEPLRTRRTQSGARAVVEPLVFVVLPPAVRRRRNPAPLPADTNAYAFAAPAVRELLIMTPAFDPGWTGESVSTRAVITASPASG